MEKQTFGQKIYNYFNPRREMSVSEEKISQLREELLEEIKKDDDLKKEVLNALKVGNSRSEFLKHPITLLILGFLLTSGVGSLLTLIWQNMEKSKQIAQTARQNSIQAKNQTADELSKLILQAYSSSADMLALYQKGEMPEIREKILLERMEYWQKNSREWREKIPILEIKIQGQFKDQSIRDDFLKMLNVRWNIGNEIPNLRDDIKSEGWDVIKKPCLDKECEPDDCPNIGADAHFRKKVRCVVSENEDMKDTGLIIIRKMLEEVKNESVAN